MLIEKTVSVPAKADEVFPLISSLEYVARCIPGARLTEQDGEVYRGELSVKVGPITARYSGTATLLELDQHAKRLVMRAQGKDQGNKGGVDANFSVTVSTETEEASRLGITADIRLRGLAAQFGRGAVDGIIDALVDEFATNLVINAQRPAGDPTVQPQEGASAATNRSTAPAPTGGGPSGADGDLDALALLRGVVGPQMPALVTGLVGGVLIGALLGRRGRRASQDCVTHAELLSWLRAGDSRTRP